MRRVFILGLLATLTATSSAFAQASNLANCKYYMKIGQDFEQAYEYCPKAIEENPEDPEARFYGAWCLAEMGDLDGARESFFWLIERKDSKDKNIKKHAKWAVERVDGYYANFFNTGIEHLNAENLKGASDAFGFATRIDPRKTGAFLNLGYTQTQLGDLDAAIQSFERAIEIDPQSLDARNYLWDALNRKLQGLREQDMPDAEALVAVRGRLRETLVKILELDPAGKGSPDAHLQLGDLDLAEGNRDQAFEHLRKAIELDPNSVVNLVNVGIQFYQDDEYEHAVDALKLVREYVTDPMDDIWVKSTWVLGLAEFELERWDDALGHFEELLEHDPDNLDYLPKAGLAARKADQKQKGDQYLIRWEELKEAAITGETVE
jgi:tetratricopeptide (TPR) repeat protein